MPDRPEAIETLTPSRLQARIFEDSKRRWADMDVQSETLALAEEAFEAFAAVVRVVVKRRHGTRGSYADLTTRLRQEVAQVGVVLFNIAAIEGFDLLQAIHAEHARWPHTDTNHDPIRAREDAS